MLKPLSLLLIASFLPLAAIACEGKMQSNSLQIYPTSKQLPENLLRFYIYFPREMGSVVVGEDIKLIEENGDEVDDSFLQNRYNLWSPDRRRLTVILNPGRVKTGLRSNDRLGRALQSEKRYAFVVSGQLTDAEGCPLGADFYSEFEVVDADLDSPSPQNWIMTRPLEDTRDPLELDLLSPHDHLSLAYRLRVKSSDGQTVPGKVLLDGNERLWRFVPKQVWEDREYKVVIGEELEDLAGNRPGVLFDQPIEAANTTWLDALPFRPERTD